MKRLYPTLEEEMEFRGLKEEYGIKDYLEEKPGPKRLYPTLEEERRFEELKKKYGVENWP